MKKLLLILPILMGLTLFNSCEEDEDEFYGNYTLASGTVKKPGDYFYVETDDGIVLSPKYHSVNSNNIEDGMRVLFYYTIIEDAEDSEVFDFYVKITKFEEILTKSVFNFTSETTTEVKDSIGNAPIHILNTWFTGNHLNVQFEYYHNNKMHFINLVYDDLNPTTEDGKIILELKHNDNGDYWHFLAWGIASFDMSQFKIEGKSSVDFLIRYLGFNEEYSCNEVVTFDYGNNITQTNTKNFKIPFRYDSQVNLK